MKNFLYLLIIILASLTFISCDDDCSQEAIKTELLSTFNRSSSNCEEGEVEWCLNGKTLCLPEEPDLGMVAAGAVLGNCDTLSNTGILTGESYIVEIDCKYELPFIHTDEDGRTWQYTSNTL